MSKLDHLESLAQWLVEGAFHRFFRTGDGQAVDNGSASAGAAEAVQRIETKEVLRLKSEIDQARQWRLLLDERELALGEPVVNLGRALDNDIIISDPTVSRYHAQLRWRDQSYYLCPPQLPHEQAYQMAQTTRLISSPHTVVNGQPVSDGQRLLSPGDVLEIGKITVVIQAE